MRADAAARHDKHIVPDIQLANAIGLLAQARNAHGDFHRLFVVQPWIDGGLVGSGEISIGETSCPASAFGDVFARQLEVHATQIAAQLGMHAKRRFQFRDDIVEAPGLGAIGGAFRIAVHWIANPQYR